MKSITTLVLVFCFLGVYAQEKIEIDNRLTSNFEPSEIKKIAQQRPDYYNYLIFQLDNSFEIVSKKEFKKKSDGKNLKLTSLTGEVISETQINNSEFNWISLPIKQEKNTTQYFITKEQTYVKLLSLFELKEKFINSGMNTK